ncbi:MAG: isochorismate synthase [Acidimicrobiia bacterium]|nr:isochorismate synthase [Acidimicrobiia bacterium]
MNIVTSDQVAQLADQLSSTGDLRIARLDVDIDPFDFARTGAALVDRAVALSTPNGDRRVGLGTAWHTQASGPGRFGDVARSLGALRDRDVTLFAGYSFLDEVRTDGLWRDYAPAEAFLPRIGIERVEGVSRLSVAIPRGEDPAPTLDLLASMKRPEWLPVVDFGDHAIESHPTVAEWAGLVESAVKAIGADELDKVVLARSVRVDSSESVAILRVFRQLAVSYPQCFNFAWKSHKSVFMGASPELLASVQDGVFTSNPLAGSAPRGEGEDEDDAIGRALLGSVKDQEEHRLVVDDMRNRLGDVVTDLHVPEHPILKKMATVQHLSTTLSGTVGAGTGVLDVVAAVHPTPAVGGVPREAAVEYIAANERLDRGWYTGGLGWITPGGDGEIAIGLRCGIVNGSRTTLFAGAGIVGDSVPRDEVGETRLKLRPLLDLVAST